MKLKNVKIMFLILEAFVGCFLLSSLWYTIGFSFWLSLFCIAACSAWLFSFCKALFDYDNKDPNNWFLK